MMATTRTAYCAQCGEDREVRITVQWQSDFCVTCGEDVEKTVADP